MPRLDVLNAFRDVTLLEFCMGFSRELIYQNNIYTQYFFLTYIINVDVSFFVNLPRVNR